MKIFFIAIWFFSALGAFAEKSVEISGEHYRALKGTLVDVYGQEAADEAARLKEMRAEVLRKAPDLLKNCHPEEAGEGDLPESFVKPVCADVIAGLKEAGVSRALAEEVIDTVIKDLDLKFSSERLEDTKKAEAPSDQLAKDGEAIPSDGSYEERKAATVAIVESLIEFYPDGEEEVVEDEMAAQIISQLPKELAGCRYEEGFLDFVIPDVFQDQRCETVVGDAMEGGVSYAAMSAALIDLYPAAVASKGGSSKASVSSGGSSQKRQKRTVSKP